MNEGLMWVLIDFKIAVVLVYIFEITFEKSPNT